MEQGSTYDGKAVRLIRAQTFLHIEINKITVCGSFGAWSLGENVLVFVLSSLSVSSSFDGHFG